MVHKWNIHLGENNVHLIGFGTWQWTKSWKGSLGFMCHFVALSRQVPWLSQYSTAIICLIYYNLELLTSLSNTGFKVSSNNS